MTGVEDSLDCWQVSNAVCRLVTDRHPLLPSDNVPIVRCCIPRQKWVCRIVCVNGPVYGRAVLRLRNFWSRPKRFFEVQFCSSSVHSVTLFPFWSNLLTDYHYLIKLETFEKKMIIMKKWNYWTWFRHRFNFSKFSIFSKIRSKLDYCSNKKCPKTKMSDVANFFIFPRFKIVEQQAFKIDFSIEFQDHFFTHDLGISGWLHIFLVCHNTFYRALDRVHSWP